MPIGDQWGSAIVMTGQMLTDQFSFIINWSDDFETRHEIFDQL